MDGQNSWGNGTFDALVAEFIERMRPMTRGEALEFLGALDWARRRTASNPSLRAANGHAPSPDRIVAHEREHRLREAECKAAQLAFSRVFES